MESLKNELGNKFKEVFAVGDSKELYENFVNKYGKN